MSAAQELFALLKDARPKHPRATKPVKTTVTVLRSAHLEVGAISTRADTLCGQEDCRKCEQPRPQMLIQRTELGAEIWSVLPCTNWRSAMSESCGECGAQTEREPLCERCNDEANNDYDALVAEVERLRGVHDSTK